MQIYGYNPIVRCICGRTVTFDENTDIIRCECGVSLTIQPHRDVYRPIATPPDGYDLSKRKLNKPEGAGFVDPDTGKRIKKGR